MNVKLACLSIVMIIASLGDGPGASAYPVYGYGPPPPRFFYRFGPYGFRRGLPNGTGYRGRGSFTGGPAGGLPSRN